MTEIAPTSSGTGPVPVAAPPAPQPTVVAMQNMWAAMTALSQSQAPPAPVHTPVAPAASPAVVPTPAPASTTAPAPAGFHTTGPWVAGALYVVVPSAPLMPIVETDIVPDGEEGPKWYAITRGHYIGVTLSNPLAVNAVVGVSHSGMKGYKTQALALAAFNEMLRYNMVAVIP
ncbi:hypothetical protein DFH06DRAFT_1125308 [Mycena polygramma]|nr:hypothetical protein DFH06DRAFT_1125308 [Mycena polygramma]